MGEDSVCGKRLDVQPPVALTEESEQDLVLGMAEARGATKVLIESLGQSSMRRKIAIEIAALVTVFRIVRQEDEGLAAPAA